MNRAESCLFSVFQLAKDCAAQEKRPGLGLSWNWRWVWRTMNQRMHSTALHQRDLATEKKIRPYLADLCHIRVLPCHLVRPSIRIVFVGTGISYDFSHKPVTQLADL